MIDAYIYIAPHQVPDPEDKSADDVRCLKILENGEVLRFENNPDGILMIPDDYYFTIECEILGDDGSDFFDISPSVVLNDNTFYFQRCVTISGVLKWRLVWGHDIEKHRGRPFYNLAGLHQIVFSVMPGTDSTKQYTVPIEFLTSGASATEISRMLEAINDNYDEISSMCLNSDMGIRSSLLNLIDRADEVIQHLYDSWNPLLSHLRKALGPKLVVTPGGLPNSPEAIHWLSENSDALGYCQPEEQNFVLHGFPVRADFAAEEVVVPRYDLFENNVIAGFFEHIQAKLADVRNFIKRKKIQKTEFQSEFSGYIRYTDIVEKYGFDQLTQQEQRIVKLQDRLYRLYASFLKKTGIRKGVRPIAPKITPFVARNKVYLELFWLIRDWYDNSRQELTLNDFAMHFIKLDKLFEFTALTTLVGVVNELGGSIQAMEWHDMDSFDENDKYHFGGVPKSRPAKEPFNYYRWLGPDGDYSIELWYEPKIRTSISSYEGDLIVVEQFSTYRKGYYLSPDFVFKINWKGESVSDWVIMDAKFSSDNTIRIQSLPALRGKYLTSLNIKQTQSFYNPIQALWALYSRGNSDFVSIYCKEHMLDSQYPVLPSIGGIRMRSSDRDIFRDKFCSLIQLLKKKHLCSIKAQQASN